MRSTRRRKRSWKSVRCRAAATAARSARPAAPTTRASGGSFKIVADTEDWDNSVGLNTPGQSGDPDSPHYRDLFELWARGQYFPMAYSRAKVDSVRESTTAADAAGDEHAAAVESQPRRAGQAKADAVALAQDVQVMLGVARR